jgi:hypothetical protein
MRFVVSTVLFHLRFTLYRSTKRVTGVTSRLGQTCVFSGAAEVSRDTDRSRA